MEDFLPGALHNSSNWHSEAPSPNVPNSGGLCRHRRCASAIRLSDKTGFIASHMSPSRQMRGMHLKITFDFGIKIAAHLTSLVSCSEMWLTDVGHRSNANQKSPREKANKSETTVYSSHALCSLPMKAVIDLITVSEPGNRLFDYRE